MATAWILDGFVGFYLTLPGGAFSWQGWKAAWRVKFGASPYRVNFDLHRAAGLWFWGLLLMMAVTAVSFNLHFEVFRPVLSRIMPVTPSRFDPARATDPVDSLASFSAVVATANEEARKRGWQAPFDVFYSAEFGVFGVGFGDHHAPGTGVPYLYFDRAGTVTGASIPGEGTAGDIVIQWMYPLHSGQIIGLPGRIAICIMGLAVAVLSITGVVIWAKKRKGRRALARREMLSRSPLPPSPAEVPR